MVETRSDEGRSPKALWKTREYRRLVLTAFLGGAEYFAVLKNNGPKGRSMLLLFNKEGQVAYQEILGESCLGVAALASKNGEQLLVGCTNKVWVYSPALPANTHASK